MTLGRCPLSIFCSRKKALVYHPLSRGQGLGVQVQWFTVSGLRSRYEGVGDGGGGVARRAPLVRHGHALSIDILLYDVFPFDIDEFEKVITDERPNPHVWTVCPNSNTWTFHPRGCGDGG